MRHCKICFWKRFLFLPSGRGILSLMDGPFKFFLTKNWFSQKTAPNKVKYHSSNILPDLLPIQISMNKSNFIQFFQMTEPLAFTWRRVGGSSCLRQWLMKGLKSQTCWWTSPYRRCFQEDFAFVMLSHFS
jgi:hypothetical protein